VAINQFDLLELVRKVDDDQADIDFLREGIRVLAQALMDADVTAQIGAAHSERNPDGRATHRNGYRDRRWDTRAGSVELRIPKLREGTYYPHWLLERRRRAEKALASVVMQAYVEGVSTRRVDDPLARAMGVEGISSSQVSRICKDLDEKVEAWRTRPLDAGPYPFVWIDALCLKVREGGRICNTSALVATAVNADGHREIVGLQLGSSETGAGWTAFLRDLVARGLSGGAAGHLRRARRSEGRDRGGARRGAVATLPHPLHRQPARSHPPSRPADGRLAGTHHLRPATPLRRVGPARPGDRQARRDLPPRRRHAARRRPRRARLHRLPQGHLATHLDRSSAVDGHTWDADSCA
jgi:putative transposase